MDDNPPLGTTLATIEDVCRQIAAINDFSALETRRNMLALRRELQKSMSQLAQVEVGTAVEREYRERLQRVRSTTSVVHAKWPVVTLDQNSPNFIEASRAARMELQRFIDWARREVASR